MQVSPQTQVPAAGNDPNLPYSWFREPFATFTYDTTPRDEHEPALTDFTVHGHRGALKDQSGEAHVFAAAGTDLNEAVRQAADQARDRPFFQRAVAVAQAGDGEYYLTRLSGGYRPDLPNSGPERMLAEGPFIDGPIHNNLVANMQVDVNSPHLRALVGIDGWMPVEDGAAGAYQALPEQA